MPRAGQTHSLIFLAIKGLFSVEGQSENVCASLPAPELSRWGGFFPPPPASLHCPKPPSPKGETTRRQHPLGPCKQPLCWHPSANVAHKRPEAPSDPSWLRDASGLANRPFGRGSQGCPSSGPVRGAAYGREDLGGHFDSDPGGLPGWHRLQAPQRIGLPCGTKSDIFHGFIFCISEPSVFLREAGTFSSVFKNAMEPMSSNTMNALCTQAVLDLQFI